MFVLRNNAFNVIYKIQTTINQTGRKNFILPPPPPPYPFFHLSPFAARAYVVEALGGGVFGVVLEMEGLFGVVGGGLPGEQPLLGAESAP